MATPPKSKQADSNFPDSGSTWAVSAKSLFKSRTFWGIVFTAVAAIAPIVGGAIQERTLSVDRAVNIVIILCGAGGAVAGRVQAEDAVYTPDWAPGPNSTDFPKASRR